MPKILFVLPTLEHGGSTNQVRLLAGTLPHDQYDLHVCALGGDGSAAAPLRSLGIPVEPFGRARFFSLAAPWRLRRLVWNLRPDVIHTWGSSPLRAVTLAGKNTARLLASSPLPAHARPTRPGRLDRWLFGRVDHFLARGPAEAERWRRLGLPPERILVIPPAVARPDKPSLRKPPPAIPNRYLACLGPLEPHNGIYDAIWAYHILHFVVEGLKLVVVGDGRDRERLERFVEGTRTRQEVHLVGEQPDPGAWLAGAEVVWVPRRVDGGIQAALEAMALGKPVVASRLPGLSEVVVEGETGFLVEPGDKVELARRTRVLLEDQELRRRFGEAGRRRAETCFGLKDHLQRMTGLYLGRGAA